MAKLTITGNVVAQPEHIDTVKAELEKLVPITRAEAGCIQYDLHQDNENPAYFLFYENWDSRDLWQAHMQAEHLSAYLAATDGMVEKFWIHELTHIA
ncbi:MAG: putative quinol monooxygenase [Pseudomonadota bacterium]